MCFTISAYLMNCSVKIKVDQIYLVLQNHALIFYLGLIEMLPNLKFINSSYFDY